MLQELPGGSRRLKLQEVAPGGPRRLQDGQKCETLVKIRGRMTKSVKH